MSAFQARLTAALAQRYTIARELGRGGMSLVYLAKDIRNDRMVALKILRPELAATLGSERFMREIKVAAGLAHPHILPLFDSGEADGLIFYVMPYVQGESLRQRLSRDGRLAVADAVQIAREVAGALDYAHKQDVVHRDIKPENILLQSGHAVVADFGIARAINAAGDARFTGTGIAIGTPEYMSPEQAAGSEEIDGRSDIYSLACVLYEMLIGRTPFGGRPPTGAMGAHRSELPPSVTAERAGIPLEVELAIETALTKRPGERYATAAEFAAALVFPDAFVTSGRWLRRLRRRWRPAVLTGVAAGLAVLLWRAVPSDSGAMVAGFDPTYIAVLPFEARSSNGELYQVAEGMTDELVQELSQVEALHVPSLRQIRALQGGGAPIDSVLRMLRVGTYVEGSVTGSSTHPRVAARLVDAATGEILASFEFDRPRGDLLRVRDELVTDLARALRERLGEQVSLRSSRAEASSVEAWVLTRRSEELSDYARQVGMAGDGAGSRRGFDQADSLAARAAQLDTRWAEPVLRRGWIAWSRAVVVTSGEGSTEVGRRRQVARLHAGLAFAEQALQRRPSDARGLELRGFLRFRLWELLGAQAGGGDSLLTAAEADLRGAVRGNSGLARAWSTLSQLLGGARGQHMEAEAAARKALEKDAYLAEAEVIVGQLFSATLERGDFVEADRWCREGETRFPDNPNFLECRITLLGWMGGSASDVAAAERELSRLDRIPMLEAGRPFRLLHRAAIFARGGRGDSARAILHATQRRYSGEALGLPAASIYVLLGERDSAIAELTMLLRAHPTWREYVGNHFWFRALEADPRFRTLTADSAQERDSLAR